MRRRGGEQSLYAAFSTQTSRHPQWTAETSIKPVASAGPFARLRDPKIIIGRIGHPVRLDLATIAGGREHSTGRLVQCLRKNQEPRSARL